MLCYRQTAITNHPKRVQRLDMYRLYAIYTSIYICIYIRNVNWSSKTWSTCTWGSFYVSFSIRRRYFRLFFFFNFFCYAFIYCVLVFPTSLVYIRYCLISVFIFSVVHHYHCTRRFVSFALHLFVHNVRSRFSSRVTRWFHPWAVVTPSSSRYRVSLVLSYPGTVMSDCASHTCSWCIFFSSHPNALSFVLLSIAFSSFLSLPLFIFS